MQAVEKSLWALTLGAIFSFGCHAPDPADQRIKAELATPTVAVEQYNGALVVHGNFVMQMTLSPYASRSTTVTMDRFALLNAGDGTKWVDPIALPKGSVLEKHVSEGTQEIVAYEFLIAIEPELADTMCSSTAVIEATFHEDVKDSKQTIRSDSFTVSCEDTP